MLVAKDLTPTPDEVEYMKPRGLWEAFQSNWTPLQRAIYLGQLRDHYSLPMSARAKIFGVSQAELYREMEGLFGILLWDQSAPDPVPCHRD